MAIASAYRSSIGRVILVFFKKTVKLEIEIQSLNSLCLLSISKSCIVLAIAVTRDRIYGTSPHAFISRFFLADWGKG